MTHLETATPVEYFFDINAKFLREYLLKMSFNDSAANKKNRVVKMQLSTELNRIDKEAQNDLRMYKNQQQRFKNKYSKFDPFNEKRGSDASDVRMYETHIPGFCYRRNGETRIPIPATNYQSVDFEDIHLLLFTDGEVDIEKVMCLHMLSAHKTDTLSPPPKTYYLSKEQSPLERLIDRSKKKSVENRLVRLLPTYVLDIAVEETGKEEVAEEKMQKIPLIKDSRLANRLIINDKISQLCQTVMSALSRSNNKKLNELIDLSRNRERLKTMVCNSTIQDFIRSLGGLNLISSCESFHLTTPFRVVAISLPIQTPGRFLENLITSIRRNIFLPPSTDDWSIAINESFTIDSSSIECLRNVAETIVKPKVDQILNKPEESRSRRSSVVSADNVNQYPADRPRLASIVSGKTEDDVTLDRSRRSSLVENNPVDDVISLVSPRRTISSTTRLRSKRNSRSKHDDPDEVEFDKYIKRTSRNLNKLNMFISKERATEEAKSVINENEDFDISDLVMRHSDILSPRSPKESISLAKEETTPQVEVASSEKEKLQRAARPNCDACMEKMRKPLPAPKTASIRKTSVPTLDDNMMDSIKTESMHKLNEIIDKNRNKLIYYERKFSKARETRASFDKMRSRSNSQASAISSSSSSRRNSVEIVDLDKLDLAKIRHEIKVNETQKKLAKFLEKQNELNKRSNSIY